MKKGWKRFWIGCGIAGAIGIALCVVGVSMGATVEAMTARMPVGVGVVHYPEETSSHEHREETMQVDDEHTFERVSEIEVDVTGISVQVLSSEDNDVHVAMEDIDSRLGFQYEQEDEGELSIKTSKKNLSDLIGVSSGTYGTLRIYLPENSIHEVDIDLGAGELQVETISADKVSITVGAGKATIESFSAKEVDFDCGAGEIDATGSASHELEVNCGVGRITLNIDEAEKDYNYNVKCGVGEVNIGTSNYSGLASKRSIDNGADKNMDIDCGIGEVGVTFSN